MGKVYLGYGEGGIRPPRSQTVREWMDRVLDGKPADDKTTYLVTQTWGGPKDLVATLTGGEEGQ